MGAEEPDRGVEGEAPGAGSISGPGGGPEQAGAHEGRPAAADPPRTRPRHDPRLDAERRMLESLVCPVTQSRLDYEREAQELISRHARLAYPIRDGIPILLVAEARQLED